MHYVAIGINTITRGHLTPNAVTIIGLLAHAPIAWLIAVDQPIWAAISLLIFGLFDALDGALARLQNRTSTGGMLLDASTDRMKETLLYTGIAAFFVNHGLVGWAPWAAAACGASLCVSYVKAKGETAIAKSIHLSVTDINRVFQDGFLRFEIRMFLIIVGLVVGQLQYFIAVIAVFATITAFERLIKIMRHLEPKRVQD